MSPDSLSRGTQRREFPRIELDVPLDAVDLTTGQAAQILDLSHGGFRTLSSTPGRPGMRHTFRVKLSDGTHCDVVATPVHSHRAPGVLQRFVVGWRAMPDPASLAGLRHLVTFVTTLATYEEADAASLVSEEGPR